MAAALVGGSALEAVFGKLLNAVLKTKDKAIMFKPTLFYVQSILESIAPVVREIEQLNKDLGRPQEELETLIREMEEGTKLVCKCSEIRKFNYPARVRYQDKLVALVGSLEKFFNINMQVQTARDQKETLYKLNRVYSHVKKIPLGNREHTRASSPDSAKQVTDSYDRDDDDDKEVNSNSRLCRNCGKQVSCLLILPCGHFLCMVCVSAVDIGPICKCFKTARL